MGYFEGLVSGSFKKDVEGRSVFYPMGVLGKGRVLPDEALEQSLRKFLIRYYKVSFTTIVIVGAFANWYWSAALVAAAGIWFYVGVKAFVAELPYSESKLTLKEGYTSSASAHNAFTLWALFVLSLLFVAGGLFIALTTHVMGQRFLGMASVVFFGLTSIAIGYMLRVRRA